MLSVNVMKTCAALFLLTALVLSTRASLAQDVVAMEAQYKLCSKHSIPADKCTAEVYAQLKAIDEAPIDPKTAEALRVLRDYQAKLKNRESMQVYRVLFTDEGAICFEIAGQNSLGGMTVSRVVYLTESWPHRGKNTWLDESGFRAVLSERENRDGSVDRWPGICQKVGAFGRGGAMKPGTDITDKVVQALTNK